MTLLNPNEIKMSFNDTKVIFLGHSENFTKLILKNRLKDMIIMYYGMVNPICPLCCIKHQVKILGQAR